MPFSTVLSNIITKATLPYKKTLKIFFLNFVEKEEKEEGEGTISRPTSPVAKEETTPAVEGEAVPAPVAREGGICYIISVYFIICKLGFDSHAIIWKNVVFRSQSKKIW